IKLVAMVRSPVDLEAARAEVHSASGQKDVKAAILKPGRKDPRIPWQVELTVPLEEKDNQVLLWARNTEGETQRPKSLTIRVALPKPAPPPKVELVAPPTATKVPSAKLTVRIWVTSHKKPRRVEIGREGQSLRYYEVAPDKLAKVQTDSKTGQGVYEVK